MKRIFPILSVLTAIFLAYTTYQALVVAPADAMQGDVYRIIYYHVPSAWTAFLLFFINFIASIQYLVSGKPSTKNAAKWIVIAIGVVGVIACFLPQVQQLIRNEIDKANAQLARVEQIKAFRVLPKMLDPEEEGEPVTPTRKVKRSLMYERFKQLVEAMYDDREERLLAEEIGGVLSV